MTSSSNLIFYVNGKKVVEAKADPEWTLLSYLRTHMRLTGTKLGCGEGGCGACTVMVSRYDTTQQKIVHRAVNACLAPLCSMEGCAVTTVEGIGSTKTRLHAVQERIAKSHGSQCGFCTPGIVMSMYTLLRNHPEPTEELIENAFDGNLCRCTGYRPILQGFRTFAKESKEGGCCKGNGGSCPCKEGVEEAGTLVNLIDPELFTPYDPSQELIFPPELLLQKSTPLASLVFQGERCIWHRPADLSEALSLKKHYPEAKFVVGNTEIGIEMKFKNMRYPRFIAISHLKELTGYEEKGNGVLIGAALPLSDVREHLNRTAHTQPGEKVHNLRSILENLQWFAGDQIRNVACIGGNLVTASPISDLNPVLVASGATLNIASSSGHRSMPVSEFFLSYRKTALQADEILVSVLVPYTRPHEFSEAYKQARRRDDDIAIVNAGMRVLLEMQKDMWVVKELSVCYGGMGVIPVQCRKTASELKGKAWNADLVELACRALESDVPLDPSAPGGMVSYRRSLTTSFFFKFYLTVCEKIGQHVDERDVSASLRPHRPLSHAVQVYEEPLVGKGGIDPVGVPVPHLSAEKQASGEAVYVDDMPRFENELVGALVLSTKAHAHIVSVDFTAALQVPGVVDVITANDVPGSNMIGSFNKDEECFATKTVFCVGQVIAMVVADTQAHAQQGAKAVKIQYEELPPIVSIEQAIEKKSFFTSRTLHRGDIKVGFAASDHIITGEMRLGGQEHFYLETQASIVVPIGEDGQIEIFASTQAPTQTQKTVSEVLNVPASHVLCRVKRLGGGFGGKESRSIFLTCALAVGAQKMRRPIRCMLDRDEDIVSTGGRHPYLARYKVGFTHDGKISALDIELYNNAGFSMDLSQFVMERSLCKVDNAYRIPHVRATGYVCKTNLMTNTAFRGFGAPQAMMIAENWISDIATKCNISQDRVRELNFYKDGDFTHYSQQIRECRLSALWEELKKSSSFTERRTSIESFNAANRWRKRGLAIVPTMFGIGYEKFLNQAGALVHIYTDGSVLVTHGGTEMGQGLHTKMAQIASRSLGVALDKVHISETSTNTVPNTSPTAASISTDLNGMAILNACRQLRARLQPYFDAHANISFEEAVLKAYFDRVDLSAHGFYKIETVDYDEHTFHGNVYNYFTFGAACTEVEIDTLTGEHEVLRTDIVMDVGASLNPAIDIGQIEGAFAQGYGLFCLEEMVYSHEGVPFTRGPGAYKIPGFKNIPVDMRVNLLRNAPNDRAVHSSKAVGEPPLFLASSVFYAIKDAISYARVEVGISRENLFRLDSPATCERVRLACVDRFTDQFPVDETAKKWNCVA